MIFKVFHMHVKPLICECLHSHFVSERTFAITLGYSITHQTNQWNQSQIYCNSKNSKFNITFTKYLVCYTVANPGGGARGTGSPP